MLRLGLPTEDVIIVVCRARCFSQRNVNANLLALGATTIAYRQWQGVLALACTLSISAVACSDDAQVLAQQRSGGGDAKAGQQLLTSYGCGSCHDIPGVRGATGRVGPPLGTVGHRSFVAGVLPNNAENMVRWIVDPPGVDSLTAMPQLGVSPEQARDMVAYLYLIGN